MPKACLGINGEMLGFLQIAKRPRPRGSGGADSHNGAIHGLADDCCKRTDSGITAA
jgi:hypothetical protein